jgi:hypothetical protein
MQSTDFEHSSNDSRSGVHPQPSNATDKSWKDIEDLYSSGSESRVPATPEKEFEEPDGQSDDSDFHTPAQPSKRRRIPSVSPVKRKQVAAPDSESDGMERDSLFESTPIRKRGYLRPRLPWSFVQEWDLEKNEWEAVYEEIRIILRQSLDEAGAKSFIKPNANVIAGWRSKQVSCFFPARILSVILTIFCVLQNYVSRKESSRSTRNTFTCPFRERCGCKVKIRITATADVIQLEAQGEHTAESHAQDKVSKFLIIQQSSALEQMVSTNPMASSTTVRRGGVASSYFRTPHPRFLLARHVLLLVRSVRRVRGPPQRGHYSHSRKERTWKAMKVASPACPARFFCQI